MAKIALVTGSGKRRVGWHVADALAGRGYAVVLHYRESAAEAADAVVEFQRRGVEAIAFGADLTDEAAVDGLAARAWDWRGGVDVLVTCAAIWKSKRLEDVRAADVREHFEANVLGTFLPARAIGLRMAERAAGGCIVTVGDWAEVRPYQNYGAYFATKGGIPTLTRTLAVELGARNPRVRVNCVLPGPVMLPDDLPEAERKEAVAATLVQREGRPANVAQAVVALVENDFVTGACLPVDGGRSIYARGL